MESAAVGPGGTLSCMAAAGDHPVSRFSPRGWLMASRAPLRGQCGFNARVSRSRFGFPLAHAGSGRGQLYREGLNRFAPSALDRVIPGPWHDMLRACSAVEVFDFFHSAGLATHSYRHHCLAALRRDSFPQFAHGVRPSIPE